MAHLFLLQIWSSTLWVMRSLCLCSTTLPSCCVLARGRRGNGARWSSLSCLLSRQCSFPQFTPSSSSWRGTKPVGYVATRASSWRCSRLSVGRANRDEPCAVCLPGPCLGSSCWSICSFFRAHPDSCTSTPSAWDLTVSFTFSTVKN